MGNQMPALEKRTERGKTPMTVIAVSENTTCLPAILGSPPKYFSQTSSVITATGAPSPLSSSAMKPLPSMGVIPNVENRFQLVSAAGIICLPSGPLYVTDAYGL